MKIEDNFEINNEAIHKTIKRLINQIYKLLPNREEDLDWQLPLSTIIEELKGASRIFINNNEHLLSLICKLEGLYDLTDEENFFMYRRTIFECLNILSLMNEEIE